MIKSQSEEYHISENGIGYWLKKYCEKCSKTGCAGRTQSYEGKFQAAKGA